MYVSGIRSGTLSRVFMRAPGGAAVSAGTFRYRWGGDNEAVLSSAELKPLEAAGWTIFHEVKAPCGNYDHIVLGSAGLFLLDSKMLQGVIQVKDGKPRICRRLFPTTPRASIGSDARHAHPPRLSTRTSKEARVSAHG